MGGWRVVASRVHGHSKKGKERFVLGFPEGQEVRLRFWARALPLGAQSTSSSNQEKDEGESSRRTRCCKCEWGSVRAGK